MALPRITFFCELDPHPLQDLFDQRLVNDLLDLHASLSLGIIDLSPQRAQVVQRLNQAGVPVIAWLLLPKDEGYWFNLDNAPRQQPVTPLSKPGRKNTACAGMALAWISSRISAN